MTHAIMIQQPGGPEEMRWEEVQVGAPGAGEVRLNQDAIGLNYIDCYHRSGLYPLPLPTRLGVDLDLLDSLHAVSALFHDASAADGDLGIDREHGELAISVL